MKLIKVTNLFIFNKLNPFMHTIICLYLRKFDELCESNQILEIFFILYGLVFIIEYNILLRSGEV